MLFCIVIALTYILVGIINAVMDELSFHYSESIFKDISWMDPAKSSLNKWKLKDGSLIPIVKQPWYYLGYKIEYVEKFPYSSTMLVWLTDPWHFCKWYMFLMIETLLACTIVKELQIQSLLPIWILGIVLALKTLRGLPFSLFFDKILRKKI